MQLEFSSPFLRHQLLDIHVGVHNDSTGLHLASELGQLLLAAINVLLQGLDYLFLSIVLGRSFAAILLEFVGHCVQAFAPEFCIFLLILKFADVFKHALLFHLKGNILPDQLVKVVLKSSGGPRTTPTAQNFVGSQPVNLASKLGLNSLHVVFQLVGLCFDVDVFRLEDLKFVREVGFFDADSLVGPGYFLGYTSVPMAPIKVICTFG